MHVKITADVNGRARELDAGTSVAGLLLDLEIANAGIAVAKNDRVVRRSAFDSEIIQDGDRIEIIRAVAGG